MSAQVLCNLRKSHCVRFWWENQEGIRRKTKPELPSVHGREFDPHALAFRLPEAPLHQDETMLDRAKRLNLLDKWQPVVRVDFNSRVQEFFRGEAALKIWGAWKGKSEQPSPGAIRAAAMTFHGQLLPWECLGDKARELAHRIDRETAAPELREALEQLYANGPVSADHRPH